MEAGGGAGCRICFGGGGDLLAPCGCRGSQLLVHRGCLNDWRRLSGNPRSYSHCPQCRRAYRVRTRELPALARALGHPAALLVGALAASVAACWALGAVLRALETLAAPAGSASGFARPHSLAFASLRWRPFRRPPFRAPPLWRRPLEDLAAGGIWTGLLKSALIGWERQQRLGSWPPYWLLPLATCFLGSGMRSLRLLAAGGWAVATAEVYEGSLHAFKAWAMRNGEEVLDVRGGPAAPGPPRTPAPEGGQEGEEEEDGILEAPALWVRQGLFAVREFMGRQQLHPHQD